MIPTTGARHGSGGNGGVRPDRRNSGFARPEADGIAAVSKLLPRVRDADHAAKWTVNTTPLIITLNIQLR